MLNAEGEIWQLLSAFQPRQTPRTRSRIEGVGPPPATYVVSLKGRPVIFRFGSMQAYGCEEIVNSGKACHSDFSTTALRASATVIMSVSGSTGEETKPHFS